MHNTSARLIQELKEEHKETPQQCNITISEKDMKKKVRKMANWKNPDLDQVEIFWLNHLISLHGSLAEQLQDILPA